MEIIEALFGYQSQQVPQPHEHPLIPFTRFAFSKCKRCTAPGGDTNYIYGGYRCNELGCDDVVFHKECAEALPKIKHSYHPQHSLSLSNASSTQSYTCSFCGGEFRFGYHCSICDFNLDLKCAWRPAPLVLPANSYGHEHPLELSRESLYGTIQDWIECQACDQQIQDWEEAYPKPCYYKCQQCEYFIHLKCVHVGPEAYPTSHPQHPLKVLQYIIPYYADQKCFLCGVEFGGRHSHCDVCNFSICKRCVRNPPPLVVESLMTHEHKLHLIPRLIDFTCNACGTHGDRSPYLCVHCNFMIHRECIGLPRVININRHDHRISYTPRLGGHRDWNCKVCRKIVYRFYGAYTCSKCPTFFVHALCATSEKVWDMIELEGTPEEEIIAPFEVIDGSTIKHFSHDHNLQMNKDSMILPESTLCEACVSQIFSEAFYSCNQCHFILHEKCANLPRKKRHTCHNQLFTLDTDSRCLVERCWICSQLFSGFRYRGKDFVLDVRCSSMTDSFEHGSHPHPLYYSRLRQACCSECGEGGSGSSIDMFSCEKCEFRLDYKCAVLPKKVMRHRYDDHPLFLSCGESTADGIYWCEACETKVNSKRWFYTCIDCGVVLHVSCVVGDFSYIMPETPSINNDEALHNISICRFLCSGCNSRCKLPSAMKIIRDGALQFFCSVDCYRLFFGQIR